MIDVDHLAKAMRNVLDTPKGDPLWGEPSWSEVRAAAYAAEYARLGPPRPVAETLDCPCSGACHNGHTPSCSEECRGKQVQHLNPAHGKPGHVCRGGVPGDLYPL